MDWSDLFPDNKRSSRRRKKKKGGGTIVATYDYRDAAGKLSYQVVRFRPKKFRQRRPDGKGGWKWGRGKTKALPYRLPELRVRLESGGTLYVVEGEKDVAHAEQVGLCATCNAGGAGKWEERFPALLLEGKRDIDVIVVSDDDDPGWKHAQEVARSFQGKIGVASVQVIRRLPGGKDLTDWLQAGGNPERLPELAENLPPPRPEIATNSHLDTAAEQARKALLDAQCNEPVVFTRGGVCVTVHAGRVNPMSKATMRGRLAEVATWWKVQKKGPVPDHPPQAVAAWLIDDPDPRLPELNAIMRAPIVRDDGKAQGSGYDERSGVLVETELEAELLDIQEAKRLLLEDVLGDFPFATASDRSAAISALLGPHIRHLYDGVSPLHLIEAPTPGSGKGLLADASSILATGREAPAIPLSRETKGDELRKAITSALLDARPILLLDNLPSQVDSGALAAAITSTHWSDRVLGVSRTANVPVRCLWLATGNNVNLSLELARRTVRCRLLPEHERPWERSSDAFRHYPLRDWLKANRARLVGAIHALIRRWIKLGRPEGSSTLGSFEGWSRVIGGIMQCAGLADPLEGARDIYARAEASDELHQLVSAWLDLQGGAELQTSEIREIATGQSIAPGILGDKGQRSQTIRLGRALSDAEDRVFSVELDGQPVTVALRRRTDSGKRTFYQLEILDGHAKQEEAQLWDRDQENPWAV